MHQFNNTIEQQKRYSALSSLLLTTKFYSCDMPTFHKVANVGASEI